MPVLTLKKAGLPESLSIGMHPSRAIRIREVRPVAEQPKGRGGSGRGGAKFSSKLMRAVTVSETAAAGRQTTS